MTTKLALSNETGSNNGSQQQPPKRLVVFDFDESLADANSDSWLLEQLGSPLLQRSRSLWADHYTRSSSWAEYMDYLMGLIYEEGHRQSDIEKAISTLPIRPAMVEAVKLCHTNNCDLIINSGCNAYFIELVLKHYQIHNCFNAIHTHKAHWCPDTGRLRIKPYHIRSTTTTTTTTTTSSTTTTSTSLAAVFVSHGKEGVKGETEKDNRERGEDGGPIPKSDTFEEHCCEQCPDDLCKGAIIHKYIQTGRYSTVAYIGDSTNDFCPCTRLSKTDHVLARKGFNLDALLTKQQHAQQQQLLDAEQQQEEQSIGEEPTGYGDVPSKSNRPPVIAQVHRWENAEDVLRYLQLILSSSSQSFASSA